MAQVVRQRATTPYLLVIVSILMVFCLGGAVFFYLQYDKKNKEAAAIPQLEATQQKALQARDEQINKLAGYIVPGEAT
ncbi:MAG TPA: hypothetical protein ENL03_03610, partial [Phycisphaerae bacterium]|nr:hypothetical protein [Phycisphaerae bacterium]